MSEHTKTSTKLETPTRALSLTTIALIRLAYDLTILIISIAGIVLVGSGPGEILGVPPRMLYLLVNAAILVCSLVAYIQIRKEPTPGRLNLLIYSLIIGSFLNSIYLERAGAFGLITSVLFTAFVIAQGFEFRKGILPMAAAVALGTLGLAFDTLFSGRAFRANPTFGMGAIWVPTAVFGLLILYLIARQFSSFSLRAKLISAFVVITLFSLTLMVLFNMLTFQRILTDSADRDLLTAASQTSKSLVSLFDNYESNIESIAGLQTVIDFASNPSAVQQPDFEELINFFQSREDTFFHSFALIDINGFVIADTNPANIGQQEREKPYFFNTMQSVQTEISEVTFDRDTGSPVIVISTPVIRRQISVVGILRLELDAAALQGLLISANDFLGSSSYGLLVDRNFIQVANGRYPDGIFTTIAALPSSTLEDLKSNMLLPNINNEQLVSPQSELEINLRQSMNLGDQPVYFNYSRPLAEEGVARGILFPIQDTNWFLGFFEPQTNFLQPLSTLGDVSVFLMIIAGVVATGIGLFLTQLITRPVSSLNETAAKISDGDFSGRVQVMSQDEFGTLATTFNMMTLQLQVLFNDLENQVFERTRDLRNQTMKLKTITEIARDVTSEEELDYLLQRTAFLLYDRFGYYHVGIYLVESHGQYVVLAESQDPAGKKLMSQGQRFRIDATSNIGKVCTIGKPNMVSISDPVNHLPVHPLLPDTKAQLSLPLRTGGRTIGAIDLQSTQPRDFTEDEVEIFATFADQIATAIQKIQFREEIQNTLNELETAYGEFTQESWRRFIQGRRERFTGYRFSQLSVEPITDQSTEVKRVWEIGAVVSEQDEIEKTSSMLLPMKVRGEVIGVLDVKFDAEYVPVETQNLITEIGERLSLVLENARLIETAQRQVEQEQLSAFLTNRIRQSLDLDTVLRTATQEIGENLGLAEVEIRLGSMGLGMQMGKRGPNTPGNGKPAAEPGEVPPVVDEEDHESTN